MYIVWFFYLQTYAKSLEYPPNGSRLMPQHERFKQKGKLAVVGRVSKLV